MNKYRNYCFGLIPENFSGSLILNGSRLWALHLLSVLIFLPSLTFGIYSSEVFPYAILFSLVASVYHKETILYSLLLCCIASVGWLLSPDKWSLYQLARSLGSFINPVIIFGTIFLIKESSFTAVMKAAKYLFLALIILGLFQSISAFESYDHILKYLVPRASLGNIEGHRGVTLISTEPARAGVELLLLYFVVRLNLKNSHLFWGDLLIGIYIIFIIKSFIAIAVYMFFLLLTRPKYFIGFSLLLVFLTTTYIFFANKFENRFFDLLINLVSSKDPIFSLIDASGNRLYSIITFPVYGLYHPLGAGLGNWEVASIDAGKLVGFDYSRLLYFNFYDPSLGHVNRGCRGSGYMTNLFLEAGVFGVLLLVNMLRKIIKPYLNKKNLWVLFFFIFNLLFIGSPGTPGLWIVTAIVLRYTSARMETV